MTKKYGKDTFRRSKKKILHKKGINTKKRGLRGGMLKLFRQQVTTSSPVANPRSHIDHDGTLHGIRDKFTLSKLSDEGCLGFMNEIRKFETGGKKIKLVPNSGGIRDYNECLSKLNRVVTFETTLAANRAPGQISESTLTLTGCKAIKKDKFKYEIFSPAATTEPPNSGAQQETLVGTFTQLPVSFLLGMATGDGNEYTTTFYNAFYKDNDERTEYFTDYLESLKNVKQNFGENKDPDKNQNQKDTFRIAEISKLREFGKSPQCKIVLVAGNVGSEIQNQENDGAIFVIASQFNGAEYIRPGQAHVYPEQAKGIELKNYKHDPTAGPTAQLLCHPVVAKFILDHAARKLRDGSDFTSDFLVINAIDYVIKGLTSQQETSPIRGMTLKLNDGYLEVGPELPGNFSLDNLFAIRTIFSEFFSKLKVLQSTDVPASGLKPPVKYTEFNWESTSKVSLIYASAVPLLCLH